MVDVTLPPDDSVTELGLNETVGPEGDTVPVSVRAPLNWLRLVRVIIEVEEAP